MNSRYQQKLQTWFRRSILIPTVSCFGIFTVVLLLYTVGNHLYNLEKWSFQDRSAVEDIYAYFYGYLKDPAAQDTMIAFISGEISSKRMTAAYRNSCSGEPVKSNLVLLDRTGTPVYSNGIGQIRNTHLACYQQILCEKYPSGSGCATRVYYLGGRARWILYTELLDKQGAPVGYAFLLLDESALISAFHQLSHEVILTNKRNLAALSTNQNLLDNRHFFSGTDGFTYSSGGVNYLVKRIHLEALDGYLYTMVELQNWSRYYFLGCAVLLVMALLTMTQSRKFADQLASSSAKSLERLYTELLQTQRDPAHQISVDTDDEFGEIAQQINHLLCVIKELNERSLAMERRRNDLEKAQIKARFHPHFLYNTLESIYFSIALQKNQEAGRMLLKLTDLLRYSLDNTSAQITLEEDMDHTAEYLDIMHFRHGEALQYRFDIAEDTKTFLVQPLLIQPLVENSLKYGLLGRGSLHIAVKTWQHDGFVHIRVSDDGMGLRPQELEQLRSQVAQGSGAGHFGLNLVAGNVKLQYGPGSALTLDSQYGSGFTAELKLRQEAADHGL